MRNDLIRYLMITCCCLLVSLPPLAWSDTDAKGEDRFRQASDYIANGRFPEAIGMYTTIAGEGKDPANRVRALFFEASVYDHYLDQYETALTIYREIYTEYPESLFGPDALYNSGRLMCRLDRFNEAASLFDEFVTRYPDNMRRRSAEAWAERAEEQVGGHVSPVKDPSFEKMNSNIRVLLKKDATRLTINADNIIKITGKSTGKTIFMGKGPVVLSVKGGRIAVNTEKTSVASCVVESSDTGISVGGKPYRGNFVVYAGTGGLTLVNHLHIEKYLYGVVPKEMSWLWSDAALKAQAIASRTYALYIREKQQGGRYYDLTATTASQVYGGLSVEKEETTKGVDATRGQIMLFEGKLIIAYFHANSGGITESSKNVWGAEIPYLKSVTDPYSTMPEKDNWSCSLSWKTLSGRLMSTCKKIGTVRSVKVLSRSDSGRIRWFLVTGKKGKVRMNANTFRIKVGATEMKSTRFTMKPGRFKIRFDGTGYGHGVGMSQWGAHQMGLAGKTAKEILSHYYRNIRIAEIGYRS